MDRAKTEELRPGQQQTRSSADRVGRVVLLTLALLISIEVLVEVRAYIRYGVTAFDSVRQQSLFVDNQGMRLLRPNAVVKGLEQSIRTNSLGLRSPEISPLHTPYSLRVAVIGASSVMGEAERDNEHTFPAQLESVLRARLADRQVDVINAGIAGYSLSDERRMLERLIAPLKPDLVIFYTGFNDFAGYCRNPENAGGRPMEAPVLTVPRWWLSYELLKKNSTWLRSVPQTGKAVRNATEVKLDAYRADVEGLIAAGQRLGVPLVILTNAKSFRREQPLDEQMRLSRMARYYTDCFDLEGQHTLWDRHNHALTSIARAHGIPVLELDRLIPGGERYFAGGSHFSEAGDRFVAELITEFLFEHRLVGGEPQHPL